jgi:hypothetical protein
MAVIVLILSFEFFVVSKDQPVAAQHPGTTPRPGPTSLGKISRTPLPWT